MGGWEKKSVNLGVDRGRRKEEGEEWRRMEGKGKGNRVVGKVFVF